MTKKPPAHLVIFKMIEAILKAPQTEMSDLRVSKAISILSQIKLPEKAVEELKKKISSLNQELEASSKNRYAQSSLELLELAIARGSNNARPPYHEFIVSDMQTSIKTMEQHLQNNMAVDHVKIKIDMILDIIMHSALAGENDVAKRKEVSGYIVKKLLTTIDDMSMKPAEILGSDLLCKFIRVMYCIKAQA